MKAVSFLRTSPRARDEVAGSRDTYSIPLSLDTHLIHNPAATYFIRAEYPSDSLRERGIDHGDLLVVDRSVEPKMGSIALIVSDGELQLVEWSGEVQRVCVYWGSVTALVRTL